jgi:hypothetical protein
MNRVYTLPEANNALRLLRSIAAEIVERRTARGACGGTKGEQSVPGGFTRRWPNSTRASTSEACSARRS